MNLILWLLILVALISGYLITPNVGVLCVSLLFVIAPIASWILLIAIRKKIEIELLAPGVVEKKQLFELQAKLHSQTKIPLGKTVMWLELTNTATGETQKKRVYFQKYGQWIFVNSAFSSAEQTAPYPDALNPKTATVL